MEDVPLIGGQEPKRIIPPDRMMVGPAGLVVRRVNGQVHVGFQIGPGPDGRPQTAYVGFPDEHAAGLALLALVGMISSLDANVLPVANAKS